MDAAQNLPLEQRAEEYFGNEADARIGSGWWSGVIAVFCGALALGGVLCLHFPQLLSSPELRPYYPMGVIRGLIEAMIWAALGFALLAALLGRRWRLALTAFLLALTAAGLGGSAVPIDSDVAMVIGGPKVVPLCAERATRRTTVVTWLMVTNSEKNSTTVPSGSITTWLLRVWPLPGGVYTARAASHVAPPSVVRASHEGPLPAGSNRSHTA